MFPKINYYISKFVKIFKLILVSFLLMGILHIWYQVLWTYDLMTEGTGYFHMFISILIMMLISPLLLSINIFIISKKIKDIYKRVYFLFFIYNLPNIIGLFYNDND